MITWFNKERKFKKESKGSFYREDGRLSIQAGNILTVNLLK